MHAGELGRHADHVDRALVVAVAIGAPRSSIRHHDTPWSARGESPRACSSSPRSSFSRFDSFVGTSTLTVTNRSPVPLRFGAPLPRTRNVLPVGVPAGTFRVTGPFSVGTWTLAPSAASGYETGSSSVRSSPFRPNSA